MSRKEIPNNALHCDGLEGKIKHTESYISVGLLDVTLDDETAWALCGVLSEDKVTSHPYLDRDQHGMLIELGKSIAPFIDHPLNKIGDGLKKEIAGTDKSRIKKTTLTVSMDKRTSYALCNVLTKDLISENDNFTDEEKKKLIHLGGAIGAYFDHSTSMLQLYK
ncbi:TPA: hypothetical protein ACPVZG_005334 [Vibrio parahaemolyticus]